ncbi:MAG: His-Xaa-Ser system radical SAM maturase HxsB [Candidatus Altiarchaeales archaeon IMC4]|nr:MAG: His-Xaa-Ser system radical SAM maturase HxsB [Candidatus Altiarchaeales archaeon IMC4]
MAYTYSIDTKAYVLNEFFHKNLSEGRFLVTTMHGGWAILSEEEFRKLRHGQVEDDIQLYNLLRQEGIILVEDDSDRIAGNYRNKYQQIYQGTTLHIMTPTLRCNQKCIYCYANSRPEGAKEYDMTKDTAKAIIDFAMQCPSDSITIELQGGEPLLNFDTIKFIIKYANEQKKKKNKNVEFRLVTNLTQMTDEKLDFILKNKIGLNSSLDGPKHVHDHNRKYDSGKGTYDDVVYWIKRLQEKGAGISCMPTITRYSLPYWKEIVDEYRRLGLNRFWARRLNIGGEATKNWKAIGYSHEEFLDFWKKCLEYILELNKSGEKMVEGAVDIVARNMIFSKSYCNFVCMASPCGCAWSQVSYDYAGNIYTCDEARGFEEFILGNVKETTYKELYTSQKVMDLVCLSTGMSFDCATCVYHPFCGPCIVDNYGENGNIIQRPNSFNCLVKKGQLDYIFGDIIPNKEKFEIVKEWVGLKRN